MGCVVLRVEILAIPARGEHQLKANSIGTVLIQISLVRQEVTFERGLGWFVVVQAIEPNGLLAQSFLGTLSTSPLGLGRIGNGPGEVALEGITCQHAEVLREGSDVLSVQKVVAK